MSSKPPPLPTASINATMAAGSFFGAVVPAGCVLDVEVPAGLAVRLSNAAHAAATAAPATLLIGQGADGPLCPVATVLAAQLDLRAILFPGRGSLAVSGDTALVVTGRVVPLRGHAGAARALDADLAEWTALCAERRELADAAEARGLSWEAQAEAQGLPMDEAALRLHQRCARLITRAALRPGVPPWQPAAPYAMPADWAAFAEATGMPGGLEGAPWNIGGGGESSGASRVIVSSLEGRALRALVTDALSPALTAVHALRLARRRGGGGGGGGGGEPPRGELRLVVLGAEGGAELSGRTKWLELLRALPGLYARSGAHTPA